MRPIELAERAVVACAINAVNATKYLLRSAAEERANDGRNAMDDVRRTFSAAEARARALEADFNLIGAVEHLELVRDGR